MVYITATQMKYSLLYKGVLAFILGAFISLQTSAQKIKVACVGNSITYGYGFSNPSAQSYPGQMQMLLGTNDWEVKNYGSSGRTMLKAGGYSYWDDPLYKSALAYHADIVIIGLGTNDSKRWLWDSEGSNFERDYVAMVRSFEALSPKPAIWIYLLVPGEKQDWDIYNSYIHDKVNPVIKSIALKNGWGLIDMYSVLSERKPEWYLEDNVHPSVTGAGLMANATGDILQMDKPKITFADNKVLAPEGYEYQWYIDGVPVASGKGGTAKEMTAAKSGIYKVSVRPDATSETRIISEELILTVMSAPKEITTPNGIKVHPNPVSDILYIQTEHPLKTNRYKITDLSGKIILSGVISGNIEKINTQTLAPGIYVLVIDDQQIKLSKP